MGTFSIEAFAAECTALIREPGSSVGKCKALLKKTLEENGPDEMIAVLQAAVPPGASIGELIVHRSPELTMLYARIPPRFRSGIHNHTVYAVIGQIAGEERSTIYARTEDGGLRVVEELSVKAGELMSLGKDVVHHIENPGDETAHSLHLYGGDLAGLADERSLWAEQDHREMSFSFEELLKQSVVAMKNAGNERGLAAVAEAIPAARKILATL